MSEKSSPKTTARWRQQFIELSHELEQQKTYEQLLERGLSRLALAANGMDVCLDPHLDSLRKNLRASIRDKAEVEHILTEIESAITAMDAKKASKSNIVQLLIALIDKVSWPKSKKKQFDKVRKRAEKSSDTQLSEILDEVARLIEESITPQKGKERNRFFSQFLPLKQTKSSHSLIEKEMVELDSDESDTTEFIRQSQTDDFTPQILLTELLERLSLPTELSSKASELRLKIHNGLKTEEVTETISSIANLVSELSSSAMAEKKEYEKFLRDLTKKITSLDKHLYEVVQEDLSAFEQRHKLAGDVEQTMVELRTDVEGAVDFVEIKSVLSQRLDHLNEQITNYQQADNTRFTESQKQIEALTLRLHVMESEANELRLATSKARALAMKDPLTGIWNRQALTEVLQTEYSRWARYQKPLTMVVWDVDYFKAVNDKFGHSAGDVVLKTIARIFKDSTRQADFIARFGGEEFVGLFPEISLEQGLEMANKVRLTIENTQFQHNGISVPITASAGLATFEKGDTIEDVFTRADKALYEAKGQGRNNCQIERK
ncbi:GGDEF domain-containing protein [Methylophaga sulfidovorans]|uniref:diguanylate cyclase n=1 Tax=Methylophaga sulfidovorans TaxID=45496 RepID=A0A1I3Z7K8_9GAMM|nr:GGDEF domain-containing protein [Methylophaga sulfidovorans]SFK40023.1 Diguanylate cyclase, GGDEF domain [Methylophaga sulfidovorans]